MIEINENFQPFKRTDRPDKHNIFTRDGWFFKLDPNDPRRVSENLAFYRERFGLRDLLPFTRVDLAELDGRVSTVVVQTGINGRMFNQISIEEQVALLGHFPDERKKLRRFLEACLEIIDKRLPGPDPIGPRGTYCDGSVFDSPNLLWQGGIPSIKLCDVVFGPADGTLKRLGGDAYFDSPMIKCYRNNVLKFLEGMD